MRPTLVLLWLCCFAGLAAGQGQVIKVTAAPAKGPEPALRYPLLPELRDRTPGNAAQLYYRAFSPEWLTHRRPEVAKAFDAWDAKPGKPPEELKWVLNYKSLREVDRAARRAYCDWELTERARKEGFSLLIPDVQGMREFARLLSLRARFEMHQGDHEAVCKTLQTALSLSRDIANGPTLIQALVGIAGAHIAFGEIDQWLSRPGCPNLYWSLTQLPAPFVDLRVPFQGERFFLDALIPGLREAMAEKKVGDFKPEKAVWLLHSAAVETQHLQAGTMEDFAARVMVAGYAAKVYPQARQALKDDGWKEAVLDALPVTQAALIYEIRNYDRIYDDFIKWHALPYHVARERLARQDKEFRKGMRDGDPNLGTMLARLLLPAVNKVMFAGVRTDRRIAQLRTVEAVRYHAAVNGGKLPATLADIQVVPVPPDPVSGKLFEYTAKGDQFTVHAPPPKGETANAGNSVTYEVTLRK